MLSWLKSGKVVQKFMVEKNNLIMMVVFVFAYSLVFINIYKPFNSQSWEGIYPLNYFVASLIMVIYGSGILAISRYIMYRYAQNNIFYRSILACWIAAEVLILSLSYTIYALLVTPDLSFGNIDDVTYTFWQTVRMVFLILFLPYIVSGLFFSYKDKTKRLAEFIEERKIKKNNPIMIKFHDEKGELRFSVYSENIVYIEAADNYVGIKYINKDSINTYMLRNSLKKVSEELALTAIHRCHRSYMVNFDHVVALRKNSEDIDLELDIADVQHIPVSKTYSKDIMQAFLQCKVEDL